MRAPLEHAGTGGTSLSGNVLYGVRRARSPTNRDSCPLRGRDRPMGLAGGPEESNMDWRYLQADELGVRLEMVGGLPIWEPHPVYKHQKAVDRIRATIERAP